MSQILSLRVDDTLIAALDEKAREYGYSRSQVANILLKQSLRQDPQLIATAAILASINNKVIQSFGAMQKDLKALVQKHLGDLFDGELEEAVPPPTPPSAQQATSQSAPEPGDEQNFATVDDFGPVNYTPGNPQNMSGRRKRRR